LAAQVPKVSIGLPVYNGMQYLAETLDRLLGQSFPDFEIVVCDNASTDDTASICADYRKRDARVRYFRNESNIGAARNFNRTFELSCGTYFAWAAYDDVHDPRFLERCVPVLDADPDIALSHTAIGFIDETGAPVRFYLGKGIPSEGGYLLDIYGNPVMEPDILHIAESPRVEERFHDVLQNVNWCLQVFGLIRSDVLRHTGLQRSYYGADKVLLAEISLAGRFHQIDEVLFTKRIHQKMSFYQTTKEKRRWIDPTGRHRFPQLHMIKDYAAAVRRTPMSAAVRAKCFVAIAGLIKRKGLWHRIFVPGPYNYLGINFSKK
jgi:glycosyltransferase involved in cell wall biosynthesis